MTRLHNHNIIVKYWNADAKFSSEAQDHGYRPVFDLDEISETVKTSYFILLRTIRKFQDENEHKSVSMSFKLARCRADVDSYEIYTKSLNQFVNQSKKKALRNRKKPKLLGEKHI